MNIERLKLIIDTYGGAPDRWPLAERDQAMALLAQAPQAMALLQEAKSLDHVLDQSAPGQVNQALLTRILAQAAQENEKQSVMSRVAGIVRSVETFLSGVDAIDWSLKGLTQPVLVLACIALLGVATGVIAPQALEQAVYGSDIEEGFWFVAFDDSGFELEEFSSIGETE